jgi:hypothetical protein
MPSVSNPDLEVFSTNPTKRMIYRDPNALQTTIKKPTDVKSRMLAEMQKGNLTLSKPQARKNITLLYSQP